MALSSFVQSHRPSRSTSHPVSYSDDSLYPSLSQLHTSRLSTSRLGMSTPTKKSLHGAWPSADITYQSTMLDSWAAATTNRNSEDPTDVPRRKEWDTSAHPHSPSRPDPRQSLQNSRSVGVEGDHRHTRSHGGTTADTQCPPPASPSSSATPALTTSRDSQGTISSIDSAASAPLRLSTPNVAPSFHGQGHAAAVNGRVPPLVIPHQVPQSQQVPYSPYTRASYQPFYMVGTQRDYTDYSYPYGPISPTHTTLPATMYSPTIGTQNPVHGTHSTMFYSDHYSVPAGRPTHSYYYSPPVSYASGLPAQATTQVPVNVSTMTSTRKQNLVPASAPHYSAHPQHVQILRSPVVPNMPRQPYGVGPSHGLAGPQHFVHGGVQYGPFPPPMKHNRTSSHHTAQTPRSTLLDEFKSNKARKWELSDIFEHILEFSCDQHGSRFIQSKLETASPDEFRAVFDEVVPRHALLLMRDLFANYVIQKLFEFGLSEHRTLLLNCMLSHVHTLSVEMYGCRVVQKAVDDVTPEEQSIIVRELEPHVLRCVKDANGNHVIQKLIECVSGERLTFVSAFQGHVDELAMHPYGCRVLQRCFEHLVPELTRPLLDELHQYTLTLMQDSFGNYVIQFVLEKGLPQDRRRIVEALGEGQMLHMARHKFASNVCEKALSMADEEERQILVNEMLSSGLDGQSSVVIMMKDQYANYVLQKALKVLEGRHLKALINAVRPHLNQMKRHAPALAKHTNAIERLIRERGYDPRETPNSQALPLPLTQQGSNEMAPSPSEAAASLQ